MFTLFNLRCIDSRSLRWIIRNYNRVVYELILFSSISKSKIMLQQNKYQHTFHYRIKISIDFN